MKSRHLAAVVAGALFAGVASAAFSNGFDAPDAGCQPYPTQFIVQQNFNVETVTCRSYFAHYDLNQYGSITGTSCSTTGPLISATTNVGHVGVDFTFLDGSHFTWSACRVDSSALQPGADSLTLNCSYY